MLRRKICEKINDNTAIVKSGFKTLHIIPSFEREYFRLISLDVNSLITKSFCFHCLTYSMLHIIFFLIYNKHL